MPTGQEPAEFISHHSVRPQQMWPADVSISSDVAALADRLHQGCDEISENVNVELESRDVRLNFKLGFGVSMNWCLKRKPMSSNRFGQRLRFNG